MIFRVDAAAPVSLAEQLASQVRRAVTNSEVEVGTRLPSARELGAALGISYHTVLRAYDVLRNEGAIELRRGRGARILPTPSDANLELQRRALDLISHAKSLGMTGPEVVTLIEGKF